MFIRQMLVSDANRTHEIARMSLDEEYAREIFVFFINGWSAGQLVAVSDFGEVVGFLSGARLTSEKATISLFAIAPSYRRMGVGSRLMEEFRIRAMMDGKRYIQLEVKDSNTSAVSFYIKMGFVAVERLSHFYNDGGNAVRMICDIRRNT